MYIYWSNSRRNAFRSVQASLGKHQVQMVAADTDNPDCYWFLLFNIYSQLWWLYRKWSSSYDFNGIALLVAFSCQSLPPYKSAWSRESQDLWFYLRWFRNNGRVVDHYFVIPLASSTWIACIDGLLIHWHASHDCSCHIPETGANTKTGSKMTWVSISG